MIVRNRWAWGFPRKCFMSKIFCCCFHNTFSKIQGKHNHALYENHILVCKMLLKLKKKKKIKLNCKSIFHCKRFCYTSAHICILYTNNIYDNYILQKIINYILFKFIFNIKYDLKKK